MGRGFGFSIVRLFHPTGAARKKWRCVEALERRIFLDATLVSPFTAIQVAPNSTPAAIDLSSHFTDPNVTGSVVGFETTEGNIFVNLFDQQTPKTVTNFLNYANSNAYDGTVLQRAVPGVLLQGGGFDSNQNRVGTGNPVMGEPGVSNTVGTIAMVLRTDPSTGQLDPNSATSDFFINDGNNTAFDAEKITAFGKVLYDGMTVVDTIEGLPKGSVSPNFIPQAGDPPDGVLPLQDWNQGSPILPSNYVTITAAGQVNPLTFSATSDNTALVNASVSGTTLNLSTGPGQGIAHITITAADVGQHTVQTVLVVQVGQTQALLGKGAGKVLRFRDPDGTAGQISFGGAGTATVSFTGVGLTRTINGNVVTVSGTPQAVSIATSGTNASSTLTITGKGGNGTVDLAGITTDAPLRAINGRTTTVTGNIQAAGDIGSITLATLTDGVLHVGAGRAVKINLGTVNSASIFSSVPIQSFTGGSWSHGGVLTAPSITKVAIKGDFLGTLNVPGALKSFTAGSLTDAVWNTGAVGSVVAHAITGWTAALSALVKLSVAGAIGSSKITTTGNITSVSAGSISSSNVSAHQIKALHATVGGKKLKLANVTTQAQIDSALAALGITSQELVIEVA